VKVFYVNMTVHNIAVLDIVSEETSIQQNQTMTVNVTVANQGSFTEMSNVTLLYDSVEIGSQNLTLNPGESFILTFQWNTSGVPLASYTLSANASLVPQEVETGDNFLATQYSVDIVPEFPTAVVLFTAFVISTLIVAFSTRTSKKRFNAKKRVELAYA
jgi:hypothetical protein